MIARQNLENQHLDDAWEGADDGSNGGKICPNCGKEVYGKPGSGPRDWHADHMLAWIKRNLSKIRTRKGFWMNIKQQLLCPTCNLNRNSVGPIKHEHKYI